MKISIAQTRPIKGDIPANIAHHQRLLELAASFEVTVIFSR
jgi:predicted amidohydrolase